MSEYRWQKIEVEMLGLKGWEIHAVFGGDEEGWRNALGAVGVIRRNGLDARLTFVQETTEEENA